MKIRLIILVLFSSISFVFAQSKKGKFSVNAGGVWAIDPTINEYYGLFFKNRIHDDYHQFECRKINIKDYLPQDEKPDYAKIKKDNLIFVLSGFDSLQASVKGWTPNTGYLYPGQSFVFNIDKTAHHFYVKGEVVNNKDPTSIEVFDGIKNYTLGVRSKNDNKITNQIILQTDFLERWSIGDYLGGITIEWLGDLNGDGTLELIITSTGHHECYQIIVLSADKNNLFKEIYSNTICGG